MYSGGSVVGKASIVGPDISPTLPVIFTGLKSAKFSIVSNSTHESLNFEPHTFENAARYPNCDTKV